MLPGKKLKDGGKPGDKVVYWDDIEREKHRVIIYQGLVYDSNGDILPDTKSNHEDHNNYVMDAAGNFYLFDEYTHPETRHSSVFAGNPVAGAGDWIIKDGRITYINNDSGHYKPGALFINVIQELNRSGVNTSTCSTSASECRPLIPQ
jgi:hypothetical protein